MQNVQQKFNYMLTIFRKDANHITVITTEDYNLCYKIWENLYNNWEKCTKEIKPFVLTDPIVTAFEPGLISEISITALPVEAMKQLNDNPYYKAMKTNGFTNTFLQYSSSKDGLLDEGYKI